MIDGPGSSVTRPRLEWIGNVATVPETSVTQRYTTEARMATGIDPADDSDTDDVAPRSDIHFDHEYERASEPRLAAGAGAPRANRLTGGDLR